MNFKSLLSLVATLALSFNVAFADYDDTPLGKEMSAMNKSLRTLKRQLADATKKEENVGLIGKMKVNLEASRKLDPETAKDVPAAEKPAYLAKYKEQLDGLGKSFDELEAALKADKADAAKKIIDKLSDQKSQGHKDFKKDDE